MPLTRPISCGQIIGHPSAVGECSIAKLERDQQDYHLAHFHHWMIPSNLLSQQQTQSAPSEKTFFIGLAVAIQRRASRRFVRLSCSPFGPACKKNASHIRLWDYLSCFPREIFFTAVRCLDAILGANAIYNSSLGNSSDWQQRKKRLCRLCERWRLPPVKELYACLAFSQAMCAFNLLFIVQTKWAFWSAKGWESGRRTKKKKKKGAVPLIGRNANTDARENLRKLRNASDGFWGMKRWISVERGNDECGKGSRNMELNFKGAFIWGLFGTTVSD